METIEFMKQLSENRREILSEVYDTKQQIQLLLQKDFFKDLLEFYKWIETIDGLPQWMHLYSLDEDCESCSSGKMRLVESIIFRLNESNIIDNIEKLYETTKKYKELKEYEQTTRVGFSQDQK